MLTDSDPWSRATLPEPRSALWPVVSVDTHSDCGHLFAAEKKHKGFHAVLQRSLKRDPENIEIVMIREYTSLFDIVLTNLCLRG